MRLVKFQPRTLQLPIVRLESWGQIAKGNTPGTWRLSRE
jgi:hypothetical protein